MYRLSGNSRIINCDERLMARRYAKRPGGTVVYVNGKPLARGFDHFEVICNVQPLSGRDLLLVPEGDRYEDSQWLYMQNTDVRLEAGDLVYRADAWHQVQSAEDWGSYTRCRIMQVDVGQNSDLTGVDGSVDP